MTPVSPCRIAKVLKPTGPGDGHPAGADQRQIVEGHPEDDEIKRQIGRRRLARHSQQREKSARQGFRVNDGNRDVSPRRRPRDSGQAARGRVPP